MDQTPVLVCRHPAVWRSALGRAALRLVVIIGDLTSATSDI
jgi:hypothetical protein